MRKRESTGRGRDRGRGRYTTKKIYFASSREVEVLIGRTNFLWLEKCTSGWKVGGPTNINFVSEEYFTSQILDNKTVDYFHVVRKKVSIMRFYAIYITQSLKE